MIPVADIELRPIEAEAQLAVRPVACAPSTRPHRLREQIVARLNEPLSRQFPVARDRQSVFVRHDAGVLVVSDRAGHAGMRHRVVARVALQIPLDFVAQRLIDLARLRQRELHQLDGKRPLEYGLVRENQHALDLPLDFRLEIEGQICAQAVGPCGPLAAPSSSAGAMGRANARIQDVTIVEGALVAVWANPRSTRYHALGGQAPGARLRASCARRIGGRSNIEVLRPGIIAS